MCVFLLQSRAALISIASYSVRCSLLVPAPVGALLFIDECAFTTRVQSVRTLAPSCATPKINIVHRFFHSIHISAPYLFHHISHLYFTFVFRS